MSPLYIDGRAIANPFMRTMLERSPPRMHKLPVGKLVTAVVGVLEGQAGIAMIA